TNPNVFSKNTAIVTFTTAILKEGISYSETYSEKPLLSIYPNPAADLINISFLSGSEEALLRIYDINGKLCFQKVISGDGESVSAQVDLNGFPKGIYSVIATDSKKQEAHNFAKQ
ncbi:MAG: T9SS type A sorting domain-containing protein, partial [Bacteroidia bacterium]